MKSDSVSGGVRVHVAAKADHAARATKPKRKSVSKPHRAESGDKVEIKPKKEPKGIRTVVFPPPTEPWKAPTKATVLDDEKAVYDGDTFKIAGYSVRVGEVNTVERRPAEVGWEEAQKFTEKLIRGKEVELKYRQEDPRDGFGRLVARVYIGGKFLPELIIEKGLGHAYFVDASDGGIDRSALIAAQERAKKAKLGLWKQERFQKPFTLTSFHPNGRGDDNWNPNSEYMRICNIASEPVKIGGYTITNASGQKWTLPELTVPVGQTVQIFSGRGENQLTPPKELKIYLGSTSPIWDNYLDKMTMRDQKGAVVVERTQNQDAPNIEKLASETSITQKQIGRLGSDVEVKYTSPKKIEFKDFIPDDGDTIYPPQPKTGTFKASIGEFTWDLVLGDNEEAPEKGTLGLRFKGLDTPETRVRKVLDTGEAVHASQGIPGEAAKKALMDLLAKADKKWYVPNASRPFDVYDRCLATIFIQVGDKVINVNKQLVEDGAGEMLFYYGKEFDPAEFEEFSKSSRIAAEGKRGIYGDGPQRMLERPADFRRRMSGKPPSRDYIADWETKLVYPASRIDMVPPWRRVFILRDDLSPALLDERYGFKLAKVAPGSEPAKSAVAPAKAVATGRRPSATSVRALELREKTGGNNVG